MTPSFAAEQIAAGILAARPYLESMARLRAVFYPDPKPCFYPDPSPEPRPRLGFYPDPNQQEDEND